MLIKGNNCSSAAIAWLESIVPEETRPSVGYFFCSFTDQRSRDVQNILGSLIVQLCDSTPNSWDLIERRYNAASEVSAREPKKLETEDLIDLIVQYSEQARRPVLVVDALNEGKNSLKLLHIFATIVQRSKHLKILVSSTEELSLERIGAPFTLVPMKRAIVDQDISTYVDTRLHKDDVFRILPRALSEEIQVVLSREANGR